MIKIRSLQQGVFLALALSCPLFAAPQAVIVPKTYPYALVTPAAPTQSDSVVMQLILGNGSNNCLSPYLSSFRIVQTSNWVCVRAPCPQQYLVKIGYAPDTRPIYVMCPMVAGPYGPTYHFGVLSVGTYTVVDTTAGNDTLLSFVVNEKSDLISISGTVSLWTPPQYNNMMVHSGPAAAGAKVYLRSAPVAVLQGNVDGAAFIPVYNYPIIDSAVTDESGAYFFAGYASGLYMVSISADAYQAYSTPGMALTKDTLLKTILLPVNATGSLSGVVSSYDSCHYVNNVPYCTGLLVPVAGCSVTVTFPPIPFTPLTAKRATTMFPSFTAITDNSGNYSFSSIPITYANQPITVIASKSGYNQEHASLSLITSPGSQNFNLEASYTNSNTIINNGMRYTIATDKAVYKATDSIFTRYTVENASTTPDTLFVNPGCQYDMAVVKPPRDTLYQYLRFRACPMLVMTIVLQPNQTLTMDFPGWKSDSAFDSLRVSAMLAGRTASAASIDVHFEKPLSEISFNSHAGAAAFKGAILAFDRTSNVLRLSVASVQSIQLDLYGLDGRKIAAILSREQCGPGTYRFQLNQYTRANGCIIAKLKTATAVSVVPVTIVR
jgi:hypothetical protein